MRYNFSFDFLDVTHFKLFADICALFAHLVDDLRYLRVLLWEWSLVRLKESSHVFTCVLPVLV